MDFEWALQEVETFKSRIMRCNDIARHKVSFSRRLLAIALIAGVGALFASPSGAAGAATSSPPVHCVTAKNPTGPCPPGSPTIVAAGPSLSTTATGNVYAVGVGQIATLGIPSLAAPIVGVASNNSLHGLWLVGADGGVFALNGASFYGSAAGRHLDGPMVGIVADSSTGYWLVGADGGVFAFGSSTFYGSMGGRPLDAPVVGMALTDHGYLLAAADGGVFAFGGAVFEGSMGGLALDAPVVGISAITGSSSYFLAGSDGGIFTFGSGARFNTFRGVVSAPVVSVGHFSTVYANPLEPPWGYPTVVTSNGDWYGRT